MDREECRILFCVLFFFVVYIMIYYSMKNINCKLRDHFYATEMERWFFMNTIIIKGIEDPMFDMAAQALKTGELVAFPTETVYGLGANALDSKAVEKIYKVKGRPSDNPLIVHISDISQINDLVLEVSDKARKLIDRFWPGPLTLIFQKSRKVPDIISAGLDTVAIRMPKNPIALDLIKRAAVPIAAPSANISGSPSTTECLHVFNDLNGKIEYVIDGGPCNVGIESTILDLTTDVPVILRPGGITLEMLESVIGDVNADVDFEAKGDIKPKSPGMKYRHYSPKAELILVYGNQDEMVDKINNLICENKENGIKTGVLSSIENKDRYSANTVIAPGSIDDLGQVAAGLFDALRRFDAENVDIIYSETYTEDGVGRAIMNRLKKASAGSV